MILKNLFGEVHFIEHCTLKACHYIPKINVYWSFSKIFLTHVNDGWETNSIALEALTIFTKNSILDI